MKRLALYITIIYDLSRYVTTMNNKQSIINRYKQKRWIVPTIIVLIFGLFGIWKLANGFAASNSTTSGTEFSITSWNTYFDNKSKNLGDQVKTISKSTSILAMQEVHNPKKRKQIKDKLLCSSCTYAGYVENYSTNGSSAASLPIIWNKSQFKLSGSPHSVRVTNKVSGIKDSTGSNSVSSKWITWVKLKNIKTSKNIYVLNTHTVASVESGGKPNTKNKQRVNLFKKHMDVLTNKISSLKKDGIPIFIAGDFNVDYRKDARTNNSTFPKNRLGRLGVYSNWQLTNLDGVSKKKGTQGSNNRVIDYVFILKHPQIQAIRSGISSSRYGSDHFPAYVISTFR